MIPRRIGELLERGLNLAGVADVLGLESDNARLRAELDDAESTECPFLELKTGAGTSNRCDA